MNNLFVIPKEYQATYFYKNINLNNFQKVSFEDSDNLINCLGRVKYIAIPYHNYKNDNFGNKFIDYLESHIYTLTHNVLEDIFINSGTAKERFELSLRINYIKKWFKN